MRKGKFKLMLEDDGQKIVNQEFNNFKGVDNMLKDIKRKYK